jgi:glutamate/tyrosine decarboxylase-like PLP-dependent enzyme
MTADAVRQALHNLRQRDLPSQGGRAFADVYGSGIAEADALGREVLAGFASTDGLDPAAYPSLSRMEQELIALTADLLDGPPRTVGTVTSGGTESTLLALRAARDSRPELLDPTVVLPTSASPAFSRAAATLRMEAVFVPVDPVTGRADADALAAAITDRTVLVAGSAPSYPHGVVDPITDIASAAARRGVRCHVDAGVGGWLLPYLARELPAFSFRVPGVTSIAVNLHTYAYTPKGASVLLHRSPELRHAQLSASAAWPGYPLVSSTALSTKSGGALAAAWAVTRFIGDQRYARLANLVDSGTDTLLDGLSRIDHVGVLVPPDASLVAVATDDTCDVFTICDELASRGWHVRPQLSFGPFPATIHLTLSAVTVPRIPEFLDALRSSVKLAASAGPVRLAPEAVAALQTVDLRRLDDRTLDGLLQEAGVDLSSGALPSRMARVDALLDAASPPVRQALLIDFLDRSSRPRR